MRRVRRVLSKQLHYLVPLPILLLSFLAWVSEPQALVQFRMAVFDEFLRLKPRQYEPVPVRIVDIDEESIERFGQWPWPRTLLAKLVQRLNELGAAVIGFDILLIDPDRTTPARVIKGLEEITPDDPIIARFAGLPDHDQVLAGGVV